MHDWDMYVRERLGLVNVAGEKYEKIVHELAGQLEECYQVCRASGSSEEEALEEVERRIGDWGVLARELRRAEGPGAADVVERSAERRSPVDGELRAAPVSGSRF